MDNKESNNAVIDGVASPVDPSVANKENNALVDGAEASIYFDQPAIPMKCNSSMFFFNVCSIEKKGVVAAADPNIGLK